VTPTDARHAALRAGTLFDAARVRAVHEALASPTLREASEYLIEAALKAPGGAAAIISLVGDRRLVIVDQCGTLGDLPVAWSGPLARTIMGAVVETADVVAVDDTRQHPLYRNDPLVVAGWASVLAAPLIDADEHIVGVVALGDVRPRQWSPADRATLAGLTQLSPPDHQGISRTEQLAGDPTREVFLHLPCLIVDADLRVIAVHHAACQEIPALAQIRAGQNLHTVDSPVRDALIRAVSSAMSAATVDLVEWYDEHTGRWFEIHPERDLRGVGIDVRDITRWKAREAELIRAAYHDSLTGLPNRRLLSDRLHQALAHARREEHVVAVLFLDLDNFKQINDHFGHDSGDQLLVEVARRLEDSLREEDTAARLGGDEFVIVLPDVTNETGAVEVAQRIVQALHKPLPHPFAGITLSTSLGIALSNGIGNSAEELLQYADRAMYEAKTGGKNQFRVFGDSHPAAGPASVQVSRCPAGIVPYYQPQMDLGTGEIVAVEALARWCHPSRGLLEAREIIPLATQSGLIVDLGAHVVEHACEEMMRAARDLHVPPLELRVNLSAVELSSPGFVQQLKRITTRHAYPIESLTVEVHEADIATHLDIVPVLEQLGLLGITIALDSATLQRINPSALSNLHIREICLATSVVAGVDRDIDAAVRAAGIVSLARSWGMTVVAKGVERRQQLEQLALIGCSRAQGYFIGRPASRLHVIGSGHDEETERTA
jgi:diguanylate cyclase (GGDEF)-like protein